MFDDRGGKEISFPKLLETCENSITEYKEYSEDLHYQWSRMQSVKSHTFRGGCIHQI